MLTVQGTLDTAVAASPANMAGTYANGTLGVGATLTSLVMIALVVDGFPVAAGDRVLLLSQTDATENGVYDVTDPGSASAFWVLTRSADFDNHVAGQVKAGLFIFVENGNVNADTTWIETGVGTGVASAIIFGTDDVVFTESTAAVYTFEPGTLVYIVNAASFGVGKATIVSINAVQTVANVPATVTYNVTYSNATHVGNPVAQGNVFADVDSALVAYKPQIT